jgi:hypothetical protein
VKRLGEGLVIAAIIVVISLVVIGAREEQKHGGCAEYERGGSLTCWGGDTWHHCEPDKVCVRYGDGTVPR